MDWFFYGSLSPGMKPPPVHCIHCPLYLSLPSKHTTSHDCGGVTTKVGPELAPFRPGNNTKKCKLEGQNEHKIIKDKLTWLFALNTIETPVCQY